MPQCYAHGVQCRMSALDGTLLVRRPRVPDQPLLPGDAAFRIIPLGSRHGAYDRMTTCR
jgi:hypothetical protein